MVEQNTIRNHTIRPPSERNVLLCLFYPPVSVTHSPSEDAKHRHCVVQSLVSRLQTIVHCMPHPVNVSRVGWFSIIPAYRVANLRSIFLVPHEDYVAPWARVLPTFQQYHIGHNSLDIFLIQPFHTHPSRPGAWGAVHKAMFLSGTAAKWRLRVAERNIVSAFTILTCRCSRFKL